MTHVFKLERLLELAKRLAGWKSKMCKGGRITLFASSLWSLLIYSISLFTIPASVASHLGKITRDFLWCNHDSDNRFHWVSWDEICCPKEDDGLGIRLLRAMNDALKTEWL